MVALALPKATKFVRSASHIRAEHRKTSAGDIVVIRVDKDIEYPKSIEPVIGQLAFRVCFSYTLGARRELDLRFGNVAWVAQLDPKAAESLHPRTMFGFEPGTKEGDSGGPVFCGEYLLGISVGAMKVQTPTPAPTIPPTETEVEKPTVTTKATKPEMTSVWGATALCEALYYVEKE
ncbi:hypothetical protein HKX48_000330 [Thoreauomyces humboldtii]|nr:hypothetical protein HKX48_000330 [Thoreauomyces humboldtii]